MRDVLARLLNVPRQVHQAQIHDVPQNVVIDFIGAAIFDMNGDGRSDLVVLHGGWNHAGVYLQKADGTLEKLQREWLSNKANAPVLK